MADEPVLVPVRFIDPDPDLGEPAGPQQDARREFMRAVDIELLGLRGAGRSRKIEAQHRAESDAVVQAAYKLERATTIGLSRETINAMKDDLTRKYSVVQRRARSALFIRADERRLMEQAESAYRGATNYVSARTALVSSIDRRRDVDGDTREWRRTIVERTSRLLRLGDTAPQGYG